MAYGSDKSKGGSDSKKGAKAHPWPHHSSSAEPRQERDYGPDPSRPNSGKYSGAGKGYSGGNAGKGGKR